MPGKMIGFIGAGKMAGALIHAMLQGKAAAPHDLLCSDVNEATLKKLNQELKVGMARDNAEIVRTCDTVFLAFKPQGFPAAVENLTALVRPGQIIISIMAGIRIDRIAAVLPGKVIRVMPNTACLVGEMAAGLAAGPQVTPMEIEAVLGLLKPAGVTRVVREDDLDAVTGLSGSGPAFAAWIMDQFVKAGVAEGLQAETARQLTLKTFAGTARLLLEWNMSAEELITMVSSPNGTTVAGRGILEASEAGEIIRKTVARAAERSRELSGR